MEETGGRIIATRSKLSRLTVQRKRTQYNKDKQCLEDVGEKKQAMNKDTRTPRQTRAGIKTELMSKGRARKLAGITEKTIPKSKGLAEKLTPQKLNVSKEASKQPIRPKTNKRNSTKSNPQNKRTSTNKQTKRIQNQRQAGGTGKHQHAESRAATQRERLSTTKKSVKKVTVNHRQREKRKTQNTKTKNKTKPKGPRVNTSVKTATERKTGNRRGKTNARSNEEIENGIEGENIGHFYFEEINSFNGIGHEISCNPHSICPVSDDKAWIAFNFNNTIYLYNKSGIIEKKLKMPDRVDDITVKPDGSLLVTNFRSDTVWSVDKTFKKIKTEASLQMTPFICRGIHCLGNETVVCYVKSMGIKRSHADDTRIIRKMSDKGKVVQEYAQLADNEWFDCLYRIALNVNGDVLVIDHGRGQLIVMGPDGEEKFRYPNKEERSMSDLYGVTCDADGFIFVSDHVRHCVDVLYPDGRYCQTLIENIGPLNNIKMDNIGDLWIGSLHSPHIRIIRISKSAF